MLLRYGEKELTLTEVTNKIPDGISPEDSVAMFSSLVDAWLRDAVLADFAEERLIDTDEIDRKVREYRNALIVEEYLGKMRETRVPQIEEIKVKEYYDRHRKELKLEVPLVKGVFLMLNANLHKKDEIKNLLASDDPEKIDRLENEWLDRALKYDYFRDKWVDWETVASLIPYHFGDPVKFLTEHDYFEIIVGDNAYYLRINEWMPPGEEQPYEFARNWITALLTQGQILDYENQLVNSIVEKSLKEKKLEIMGYDPLKHELLTK